MLSSPGESATGHARSVSRTPSAAPAAASAPTSPGTPAETPPPTCTRATSVNPASAYGRTASTKSSGSLPQGMDAATSSGRTNCVADAKESGAAARVDLPAVAEPAELRVRPLHRRVPVGVVAHRQLAHPRLALASTAVERLQQLRLRLGGDHQVRQPPREGAGPLARHRDPDRRRLVRQVPQPGRLHVEVLAPVVHMAALEQRADDLHRLPEHLVADVHRRPAAAHHVLVEVLAGAQSQPEPAVRQQLHRRRLLRHHRRVVAHRRTRHVRHQRNPRRRLRGRAQHAPRVRRVTLLGQPREVVVRGHREVETRLLGTHHVLHQLTRPGLLGHHRVPDSHHAVRVPAAAGENGGSPGGAPGRMPP